MSRFSMDPAREEIVLDEVATRYDPSSPNNTFDYWFVRLGFETLQPFLHGPRVLEMGCSTGHMTRLLAGVVPELTVVEGSRINLERTAAFIWEAPTRISLVHSLWESYTPTMAFDDIVLAGALEHVTDPIAILRRIHAWLRADGRLHVIVPNGRSLHRRIGVAMGILQSLEDFSESDRLLAHRRVYTRDTIVRDLHQAGFEVHHWQGIILKPLSNAQMQSWPEPLIRALYTVGLEIPDYCGELYCCCQPARLHGDST